MKKLLILILGATILQLTFTSHAADPDNQLPAEFYPFCLCHKDGTSCYMMSTEKQACSLTCGRSGKRIAFLDSDPENKFTKWVSTQKNFIDKTAETVVQWCSIHKKSSHPNLKGGLA